MLVRILRLLKYLWVSCTVPNIKLSPGVIIDFGVSIRNRGKQISIGEDVYLRSIARNYHAAMPFPTTILLDKSEAELKIGRHSRINGAYIHAQDSIKIGEKCLIASGVNILDSNGHPINPSDRANLRDHPAPIVIGNNVWIGINSIILKGSRIGNNCVVAAGSVVKGEFPDNTLIMGNPARAVKKIL